VAPPIAGLPNFTDEEAIVFLMTGVRPNGSRPLPPMPAYRLSRPEAADVVAYLRSVAPAK
jgi:mono/diheme cytochrome c family protein